MALPDSCITKIHAINNYIQMRHASIISCRRTKVLLNDRGISTWRQHARLVKEKNKECTVGA
jgi:hypothetical protein